MKTKDHRLLEEAYFKILSENEKFQPNDPDMQELSKIGMGEEYPEDEDLRSLESDDEDYVHDSQERYDYNVRTFGQDAVDYAYDHMKDDEYADNLRMAFVGDQKTEKIYNMIKNRGCCGFNDNVKIPTNLTNGREAYFGYNYGH